MFNPLMESTVLGLKLSGTVCEFGSQRYGGTKGYSSVKAFYLGNGFTKYVPLDVNNAADVVLTDLNYPVEGLGQFDLVTNNGTSEHLWNQHQVFLNAHNLCKVGGVMLHVLPFTPYYNHGFFNYNPCLFRDLATANDYEILVARLGHRDGKRVDLGPWGYRWHRNQELEDAIKKLTPVMCVFALKKTREDFRMPMQGKYAPDVKDESLKERYGIDSRQAG